MNELDLTHPGGFPLDVEALAYAQSSWMALEKLAVAIAGYFPAIIDGCIVSGSQVSDGTVIINGKLYPFKGGTLGTKVSIVETIDTANYENGVVHPFSKTRVAQFSVNGVDWSSFARISALIEQQTLLTGGLTTLDSRVDLLEAAQPAVTTGSLVRQDPYVGDIWWSKYGRVVNIAVRVEKTGAGNMLIANIPANLRPLDGQIVRITPYTGFVDGLISFTSGGQITALQFDGNPIEVYNVSMYACTTYISQS